VQLEISLGILMVLATGTLLIYQGLREQDRMALLEQEQRAQAIEVGADLFDTNCKGCHGPQGEGTPGLCPPLNDKNFFTSRLKEVGWSGSLEDYIVATVSSGRLVSTRPELYPGNGKPAMPAWSDQYGGPLRVDQIRYIAAFIMNWESTAPVRQQLAAPAGPPVGTDITQKLPTGDAAKGQTLATSLGCTGCHVSTTTGPAWMPSAQQPGIGERANTRFTQSDYTGKATSAEQYLLESIVDPAAYHVPGYEAVQMPPTYGQTITAQDAADLIAYLLTLK
jgi:mono/diheme cytochrome c family protein/cytochrome c551/c552